MDNSESKHRPEGAQPYYRRKSPNHIQAHSRALAQTNRLLLTQEDYLSYIRSTSVIADEIRICTWGLYSWMSMSSFRATLACLREAEVIVGYQSEQDFHRIVQLAAQYPKINWRFRADIHAKYALCRLDTKWEGVLGSSNLCDSSHINVSTLISRPAATMLARLHEGWFKQGITLADARQVLFKRKRQVLLSLEEMSRIPAG